jgi:dienelactone hydrolase
MNRFTLPLILMLWCAICFGCATGNDDDDGTTTAATDESGMCDALAERVELFSEDNLILAGCFYPADNTSAITPSLLLLHQMFGTHSDYDSLARRMNLIGYAVLSMDLRGHGESTQYDTGDSEESVLGELLVENMNPVKFQFMAWDIKVAIDELVRRGLSRDRVAIIGASIGANIALAYIAGQYGPGGDPQVKAVALLSPGEEYSGVNISNSMINYSSRPILLMAGANDEYSASMVGTLESQAAGTAVAYVYEGTAAHGTDILGQVSEATGDLTEFFQTLMPPPSRIGDL